MSAVKVTKTTDIKQQTEDFMRKIGGSAIGAIMGVNPWQSRMEIYAVLSGLMPGPEENEAMFMGKILEPVVARLYQEKTGNRVRRVNYLLQHPDYDFATANIDREIYGTPDGNGILEVKTASEYQDSEWRNGNIPPHYMCQLQWYLWITGYKWGSFAALVGGNKFYTYRVERDEALIDLMVGEAYRFWHEHILRGVPPQPDASDSCKKALDAMYPTPEPLKMAELPDMAFEWIQSYQEAGQIEKEAKAHKDDAANKLRAVLGDAEVGVWNGQEVVTWKASKNGNRLLKVKGVK